MKPEFKLFEEIMRESAWKYANDRPIGQQWQFKNTFFTNKRGEGFTIHGGTKFEVRTHIVNLLNKREYEIAKLKEEFAKLQGGEK